MDEFERNLRYGEENQNQGAQSDLAAAIRTVLSGQTVLAMIIMLGLRILGSISAGLITKNSVYYQVGEFLEEYVGLDVAEEYYDVLNSSGMLGTAGTISTLIGGIIGSIPVIIALVGFILVYTKAKENSDRMDVTGFKILKVMNMIGFVCYIISAVLGVIIPIIAGAFMATIMTTQPSGLPMDGVAFTSVITFVLVFVGIISAAFTLLYIFRNYGFHKSINCIMTALSKDRVEGAVSEYAAGVSIVFGVISLFPVFTALLLGNWNSALVSLGSGVYMILIGVNLNKLKRLLNQTR